MMCRYSAATLDKHSKHTMKPLRKLVPLIIPFVQGATIEQWLYSSEVDDAALALLRQDIVGVQALYSWKSLEKQLWVQLQDRTFNPTNDPVPIYMHSVYYNFNKQQFRQIVVRSAGALKGQCNMLFSCVAESSVSHTAPVTRPP